MGKLFGLVILVQMGLLLFFGRGPRAVVTPLVITTLAVFWTMGTIGLLGFTLNLLSSALPTMLICVSIANSVFGRPLHIASQDFTVMGGSAGETQSNKVAAMMDASATTGTPFIFINDSGGARVQEGIDSLSGYGKVFYHNVLLSGLVPQISIIAGPCAGGAAYSPALTDFIIQTRQANMFITGPGVIKSVTGEEVTTEQLGGADAHMSKSGNIHFIADDDEQAILIAQKLLSFLPQNNTEEPPVVDPDPVVEPDFELRDIVPVEGKKGYDVREIITRILDRGDFLEVQAGFARNIVVGFGRIVGRSVGVIANQPNVMSGVLRVCYVRAFCKRLHQ